MNLDIDTIIDEIDSYVEYQYGLKRIGIFGKNISSSKQKNGQFPFSRFLSMLTAHNNPDSMIYDFYYSNSVSTLWLSTRRLRAHAPKIKPVSYQGLTTKELKLFIKDVIGPLINTSEPIFGKYTSDRVTQFLRQAVDTENEHILSNIISRLYNVLDVKSILIEMFSDKSAKNCIVYVTGEQLHEFDYFFNKILLLKPTVGVKKGTPISFNRKHKRNSFLFERTEIRYIKSFYDSDENCGQHRHLSSNDMFLLSMCEAIPLSDVQNIYGPITYAELTDGERNIAIFGEDHRIPVPEEGVVNKRNTVSVPSLLKIILDTFPTKFYDLFIEIGYSKDYIDQGITSFYTIFGNCLKVVKECPFDNIRAHYTDYRSILNNIEPFKTFSPYFNMVIYTPHLIPDYDPYLTVENLIDVFDMSITLIKYKIISEPKLRINFRTPLYYFVLIELDKIKDEFSYFVEQSKDQTTPYYKNPLKYEETATIFNYIMDLYMLIMDIYTLGRMFKTFAPKNPSHPQKALNSLIYVGELHAKNYRTYLTSVGFKMVHYVETELGKPLDFKSIRNNSFLFKS